MRPLKHWLADQNVPHEVDPTCSTPSRIGSRSFSNLKLEEFACPPELLLAPRYVEATAGTQPVTLIIAVFIHVKNLDIIVILMILSLNVIMFFHFLSLHRFAKCQIFLITVKLHEFKELVDI